MLLAVAMVTKSEDAVKFECLSKDKDYYNSDEMVYRRKHKCGCGQFCCINTATLTVSGLANFNGSSVNILNQLNLNGVNLNNLFGISGAAGINGETAAVGLVDQAGAQTNAGGAYGLGLTTFGSWYNAAGGTVNATLAIPFATQAGANSVITHPSDTTFVLPSVGTYEVSWFASISNSVNTGAQLSLYIDGTVVPQGVIGTQADLSDTGAPAQLFGTALVTTTVANAVLEVRNSSFGDITLLTGDGINTSVAGITIKRIA